MTSMTQEFFEVYSLINYIPPWEVKKTIYKSHYTSVYHDSHNLGFVVQA